MPEHFGRVRVRMVEGYRGVLGHRRFMLYLLSTSAAGAGYAVYAITIPWIAFQFSGSLFLVGLVLFVEYGVYSLTFLVAPWVDRARNKRTIFLACYPVQAAASALIGFGLASGWLSTLGLLALVATVSLLWDLTWAAGNVVPRMLLPQDQLFAASGLGGLVGGITQISAYAAGGALIVVAGPPTGMYLYAGLLVVAAAVAILVSIPVSGARGATKYWSAFKAGWRHFSRKAERSLLQLGSAELVRGFFVAGPTLLITAAAGVAFAGGVSTYTILFASWVVGGVLAGLVLGELNPRRRVGWILLVSAAAEGGLILVAVIVAPSLAGSAFAWALIGAAGSAYVSARYVFVQGAFPADALGRISANLYLFTGASSAIGAVVLGALATTWSFVDFGLLVGVGFLFGCGMILGLPGIRRLAF